MNTLESINENMKLRTETIEVLNNKMINDLEYSYSYMIRRMVETSDISERRKLMTYFIFNVMKYDSQLKKTVYTEDMPTEGFQLEEFNEKYESEETCDDCITRTIAFDFKNMLCLIGDTDNPVQKIPNTYPKFQKMFLYF